MARISEFYVHVINVLLINIVFQVLRHLAYIRLQNEEFKFFLLEEFLFMIEVSSSYRQLGFIEEVFGIWNFAILSIIIEIWWKFVVRMAAGNPIYYLAILLRTGSLIPLYGIAAELLAAPVAWLINMFFWNFHSEDEDLICHSLLQISMFQGMLVEGALAFAKIMFEYWGQILVILQHKIIEALLDALLVLLAVDLTGGFYNPIVATVRHFECHGHTAGHFFMVYWVGPIIGAILANLIYGWFVPYEFKRSSVLDYLKERRKRPW